MDFTKISRPSRCTGTGDILSKTSNTWLGNVADRGGG
jgi:hypothetical protein